MGRNLHIEKVFIASRDYRGIKNKVVSKELLEVAGSFEANMIRVEMLLRIFLDVIVWALDFQRLSIKVNLTIFNTIEPSLEQSSIDHLNRHRAEFNRLLNELIEQFTTNREKVLERAFQMSWGNLDVFTSYFPDEIILGFESMLSSMVIGSWTAFEVLAADLWEACLNARPRLGVIALNAEPESADEDLVDGRTRGSKYSISCSSTTKVGL